MRKLTTQQLTGQAVQKVNWWHEQIVDWELMNPDKTLGECAEHFGVTQPWLSSVRGSDAFKEYRAIRIAEHQGMVSKTVIEKVEGLAHLTLDVLQERIEKERAEISLPFMRETAETALKALGYSGQRGGAPGQGGVVVQTNVVVDRSLLSRARERMRTVNQENAVDPEETSSIALPASQGI